MYVIFVQQLTGTTNAKGEVYDFANASPAHKAKGDNRPVEAMRSEAVAGVRWAGTAGAIVGGLAF